MERRVSLIFPFDITENTARGLNENYSDTEKIKFDWLQNFLYIFTFVLVFGAVFDFTNSFIFKLSYIQYFYFESFSRS